MLLLSLHIVLLNLVQGSFVLCRLFRKSEEKTPIFDNDDFTQRNVDEKESIGLFAPATPSPGETLHGIEATEEVVTPMNQKNLGSDLQEILQPLPLKTNVQPSGVNGLAADKTDITRSYPLKPEESHCNDTIVSDAANHGTVLGSEVSYCEHEQFILICTLAYISLNLLWLKMRNFAILNYPFVIIILQSGECKLSSVFFLYMEFRMLFWII